MIPILRRYQERDVEWIREAFGKWRRVLYVSPTGSGKTVCFAFVLHNAVLKGKRVVVMVHREEILDQICAALDAMGLKYGRITADEGNPTDDLIQVAMVMTLANRLARIPEPDLLIIDEAHHSVADTYQRIAGRWLKARILGVTATPERLDGRGLREVFDWMVVGSTVHELIDLGFLAPYSYLAPPTKIDMRGVRSLGGDFNQGDLERAVDQRPITGDVIEHYCAHLDGRTAIAFCITVGHAANVAQQFSSAGIPAASIDGSMGRDERRDLVTRLRTGDIRLLTSCMLISEGFDVPSVNGIIMLRPTMSLALFLQMVGRGSRPKADGSKSIILDHVANVERHGLPDQVHAWSLDSKKRTLTEKRELADFRNCKACNVVFPRGATVNEVCPDPTTEGCVFTPKVLLERPGTLKEVTAPDPDDRFPPWTGGIDLETKVPWEFGRLMWLAGADRTRLRQMQQARGYEPGWVWHASQEAAAKRKADG
jgi:DNA repair protein RadD